MNINISSALAGATAATLFGENILGLGRAVAGATAFTTAFGSNDLIENISSQTADMVSYENGRLHPVAKLITSVSLNALALYATMFAVTTALSFTSVPVAAFSFTGALGISTVSAIASKAFSFVQNDLNEPVLDKFDLSNAQEVDINGLSTFVGKVEGQAFSNGLLVKKDESTFFFASENRAYQV